jgi:hypothetical protein
MKVRLVLGVVLSMVMGCSSARHGSVPGHMSGSQLGWTVSDAWRVLESAAGSDDPELRSLALPFLVSGSAGEAWLQRGWLDPSRAVQRAIARSHPLKLSPEQLMRPGADPLAVGLVLASRDSSSRQIDWSSKVGLADELVRALAGEEAAKSATIDAVREGMIPPEPLLVELLVRSELGGMGEAMAVGALVAEDEMRLPLALGAQVLDPKKGSAALLTVLREADEMTRLFAVEALTREGGEQPIVWLRRAAQGESGAVSEHAKLGLVALGLSKMEIALQGLSSPDRDQRVWAATCLGLLGRKRPLPRGVVVSLQSTWRDESAAVRHSATVALIAIAGIDAVPLPRITSETEPDAVSVMVAGKWIESQGEPLP